MNDFGSNPQSQMLYAMKIASPDDSMMLVLLITNPIKVRNTKAVMATPNKVEDRGEAAAAG